MRLDGKIEYVCLGFLPPSPSSFVSVHVSKSNCIFVPSSAHVSAQLRGCIDKKKTHWMLAPTRQLRSQHLAAALESLELEEVCPAGADESGEDLYVSHGYRIIDKHAKPQLEEMRRLEEKLFHVRNNDSTWRLLSEYERLNYKIYSMDANEALKQWGSDGCVAVATHDYYLKVCAGGDKKPKPLRHDTGVVFMDEATEATVMSTLAAASGEARPLVPNCPHTPTVCHAPLAPRCPRPNSGAGVRGRPGAADAAGKDEPITTKLRRQRRRKAHINVVGERLPRVHRGAEDVRRCRADRSA